METFNLNIIPGKTCPVCHASQYDIGRIIRINLFENAAVYTLDGTETVSISVRKPDGNVVTESVTNTSDSYVEFVTTEQMTACHGSNLCELKLEKGADVIGTMNFILEVEQDPLEGGVQSASEIDNLQTQIAGMVATEVADQYDSANVIFDAAPTAGHGVPYTVTSEGIKNEIDTVNAAIAAKPDIDDVTPSQTAVYSSDKVDNLLTLKQDATDANLQTTDTTVVGAINELKSGVDAITTRLTSFIVSETVYSQSVTIPVVSPLVVTVPNKTGYTALCLGTTYAGGSSSIMFVYDTPNRIHCRNISGVDFTGTVTINVVYVKN